MVTVADKFWIAVLFLIANIVRSKYHIDFGLTEPMAASLIQGIGAALVWYIPNKKPHDVSSN